ncbi:MAG: starch-binding protein [Clostridia bacterium]|nr:starch-binding protein [Clostridia bacterium]
MTLKRTMCALLAASLLASGVVLTQSSASANTVDVEKSEVTTDLAASYGLASNIQDGVILHCFDWTYNDIKDELPNIAAAGFTSVQTSPAQPDGTGVWYWLYQPKGFYIGNNGLGTKQDLTNLCTEAEKYGVKVVVDVVANHLNGQTSSVDPELQDSQYWHNWGGVPDDKWGDRNWVIYGEIGMRDLATENTFVQQKVKSYVEELKSVGVDGIRWDAAKHIGLPGEQGDFWPTVTSVSGLWHYGEILDNPGGDPESIMKQYTNYISITDSGYGHSLRDAARNGSVPGGYANWAARGLTSDKIVYWGESHDTWANAYDWGYSHDMSQEQIDRCYANVAARAFATSLYFSRPFSDPSAKENTKIGAKGSTSFTNKAIAEVNKFHNAMVGKKDWYTAENGVASITRQGGGAVVIKGSGGGQVTIANGGGFAKSGTYTDAVSGNQFTITDSTISGNVGDSGIAVLYDGKDEPIIVSDTDTTVDHSDSDTHSDVVTGDVNIYFDNSSYNWGKVFAYVYTGDGDNAVSMAKWPGTQMTLDSKTGYYKLSVKGFENGRAIFSDGNDDAAKRYPADMDPGLAIGGKSKILKANHVWEDYKEEVTTDTGVDTSTDTTTDTTTDTSTPDTETDTKVKVLLGDANQDGKVSLRDASLALKVTVKKATLTDKGTLAADVDGNGNVTAADSLAIQRFDIGIASGDIGKTVEK